MPIPGLQLRQVRLESQWGGRGTHKVDNCICGKKISPNDVNVQPEFRITQVQTLEWDQSTH